MVSLLRRRAMMVAKSGGSNRLYLFNNGDECTAVTGGWEFDKFFVVNGSRYTAENDGESLAITATAKMSTSTSKTISTFNAIDLTGFSKMVLDCVCFKASSAGYVNYWVYLPTKKANATNKQSTAFGSDYANRRFSINEQIESGTRTVLELDISTFNEPCFICLNLNGWGNAIAGAYGKTFSMHLE